MSSQTDASGVNEADCPITICSTPAEAIALTLQEGNEINDNCENGMDSPVTICSTPAEAIALTLEGHERNETTNNFLPATSATNIELDNLADVGESDLDSQSGSEAEDQSKKESSQLKTKSKRRCLIIIGVLLILGLIVAMVGVAFGTGIFYAIRQGEVLVPILILFKVL